RAQEAADADPAAPGDQIKPLDAELLVRDLLEPHPQRIEHPFGDLAAVADPAHPQLRGRDGDLLARFGGAEIDLEGPIDHQHVEAEEAEDRPGAEPPEHRAGDEADHRDERHQHDEAGAIQRAMRCQQRREQLWLGLGAGRLGVVRGIKIVACSHDVSVYPVHGQNHPLSARRHLKRSVGAEEESRESGKAAVQRHGKEGARKKGRQEGCKAEAVDGGGGLRGLRSVPQGQSRAEGRARAPQPL
ncbi:hypothetical protein chiPu_0030587, partial [Chiloscyllium punctatum]|nr:hypothetical protein [Chiloscyllium punctatum]